MDYEFQEINLRNLNPVPINGGSYLRWAHHPHCDRHNHHLIWIFGHPFCLGCTCMYSGVLIGLSTIFIFSWTHVSVQEWLFWHLLCLLPTLVQPWFQKKPFKIISRFLLGATTSSYFVSGLLLISPTVNVWLFRIGIIALFLFLYRAIRYVRNRYTYNPCSDCPLGVFPTCDWNLPRLLNENPDLELLRVINNGTE